MWCFFSIFYGKNQHKRTDSDRNNGNRNYRRILWFIPFPYKTSSAATRSKMRGCQQIYLQYDYCIKTFRRTSTQCSIRSV